MSQLRQRILELNPELFSMRQPSKEHDVFVVGRKKDKDGTVTTEYLLRSKPSEAAKKAGIKASELIHAAFMPTGSIKTGEDGKRSYQGPKKARVGVVFLNTQPNLYNFLKEGLEEGKDIGFKEAGTDSRKRPMVKMRDTVYGLKITFLTDLYNPHQLDPAGSGKIVPLESTVFKPATGEYKKEKTIMGSYTFFADDDDLDNLLEICTRHYQKNVAPYVTEKTTVIKEKGQRKVVEVKEEEITGPENENENEGEEPETE